MSLRSGKLPFLGSEDEFLDHRSARTRSPGLKCFTFAPTARTTPLTSRPKIAGNDNGKSFCRVPERIFQSIGLTLAAAAAISTVRPLICGSGTLSSTFSFSGPPYSCSTTALIAYLLCRPADSQAYSTSHQMHGSRLASVRDNFRVRRHSGALGERDAPWYIIRRLRNFKIGVPA